MGLLKTAAKVAVASSVHGRVQRRQQDRWSAADQRAAAALPPPPATGGAPAAAPVAAAAANPADTLAQLTQLGELRAAGILTDAEFDAQKARILSQ